MKEMITEVLYTKRLTMHPYENQMAKEYARFMQGHPDLSEDDVRCKVDCQEVEEDHYGNGGGIDRTLVIYTEREESDKEYNERMNNKMGNLTAEFEHELSELVNEYLDKFDYEFKDDELIKRTGIIFLKEAMIGKTKEI